MADRGGGDEDAEAEAWSNRSYFFSASRNSDTVSPAERIRLRKVPLATSLWSGTDKVATYPSLIRIMWLPLCLTIFQPSDSKARTVSRLLRWGSVGIRRRLPPGGFQLSGADLVQLELPGKVGSPP